MGLTKERMVFFMSILQTTELKKYYGAEPNITRALDGVTLSIEKGEFVAIVGTSGSGKSTLLNMIGGLDVPTSGQVVVDGKELSKLKDEELTVFRRRKIGFIFQNFNLIAKLSAEENVELPLVYRGVKPAERAKRVAAALERVGLSNRAKHLPTELSGGQQQRVAIARALVTEPSLLLADEPTGNLDSKTSREIMDILHELHEQGNTVVLITHDNDIARQAKRSIHILDGRVTEVQL